MKRRQTNPQSGPSWASEFHMSVFKIFTFGAFGLITIMVWRLGIIPPIYDGFVNGVTTLRTHTVYVDGVPTRQAKISSWRIKFPDGIPRTSDGATIFNDFDQRGSGRAGAFWMALASWLKNGSMIYNPTENAKHDFAAEYFAVVVDNMLLEYREFPKLVQRDYCLPNDGIKGRAPCLEGFPSCSISINYHGGERVRDRSAQYVVQRTRFSLRHPGGRIWMLGRFRSTILGSRNGGQND